MKVPMKWLKEFVEVTLSPDDLAVKLTAAGLEVESIENPGAEWKNVFVGQVEELGRHPNAERLLLATISYGEGRKLTVVTGAQNMAVGDKVPLALVGATLIDGHKDDGSKITLKPTKLRGVTSEGMACSAKELGLSDEHEGILILEPDAPVGAPLAEVLGDIVLDVYVSPNRGDCLSVLGIAREVAALTGQMLKMPDLAGVLTWGSLSSYITVELPDPDLCPRYSGGLIRNVKIGPSPKWLQERLTAAGMRPINNVVDITNYVMLELGQPLHAFDYDTIAGKKIIVRRAWPSEKMETLDGQTHDLSPNMLVIADAEKSVGLAGVMGGLNSEVTENTTTIFLESAHFDPINNRRTAQALKIRSEASLRFERGVDPAGTVRAVARSFQLMRDLAGGEIVPGITDEYPGRAEPRRVYLAESEPARLLGMPVEPARARAILYSLGFEVAVAPGGLDATVPTWRPDAEGSADLVEEVARIIGYDNLPTTLMRTQLPAQEPNPELKWEQAARRALAASGLSEILTYPLTSSAGHARILRNGERGADPELELFILPEVAPIMLANPISSALDCLRTSLLVTLLDNLTLNARNVERDLATFELGKVYLKKEEGLPDEPRLIALAMTGPRSGRGWGESCPTDFYDLKGAAQALTGALGLIEVEYEPAEHPSFRAGALAKVKSCGETVGLLGALHPVVAGAFELGTGPVYVGVLHFGKLIERATDLVPFEPLPRFPAVREDLAVVVDEALPAARVVETIRGAGGKLVRDVELFDVYRGKPLEEGKKSLAYRVTFQADDRTLTDADVANVRKRIVRELGRKLEAMLREG